MTNIKGARVIQVPQGMKVMFADRVKRVGRAILVIFHD